MYENMPPIFCTFCRLLGHTQTNCIRRLQNQPPFVDQNLNANPRNDAAEDAFQFLNMDVDAQDNNINSSSDTNGSTSEEIGHMPSNAAHRQPPAPTNSLEALVHQMSALNSLPLFGPSMPAMAQISHLGQFMELGQPSFANPMSPLHHIHLDTWLGNYIHLGTSTTMIEIPSLPPNIPFANNTHHNPQEVEPYIPMPLSLEQALNIRNGTTNFTLQIIETQSPATNRNMGIVIQEPNANPNLLHDGGGRCKRRLENDDHLPPEE